jgi:hypothetical protein
LQRQRCAFVFNGSSNAGAAEAPLKARPIDELTVRAEIPRSGDFMAWGFDALWMMAGETAIHENSEWIPDARNERIHKFDPIANKLVLTIPVPFSGTEGSIGVGEGTVSITARGNVLARFNALTGAMEATIKLDGAK